MFTLLNLWISCWKNKIKNIPRNDTRGFGTNTEPQLVVKGAFTVNGISQGVDNTPQQLFTDGDVNDGTGTFDNVSFLDVSVVTEYDNTDVVGLQVKGHTFQTGAKFHHLVGLDVFKTIYTGDTITNAEYTTGFFKIGLNLK